MPGGQRRKSSGPWVMALVLLGAAACDPPRTVDDSGRTDVPTTESSPPYPAWILDTLPAVRIGALDGAPESQLSRVGYAARLSDGRMLVYDGASSELRWFDPEGRFLLRAGGPGQGPGEFRSVVGATVTARDQVVLYDFGNQRLSWFRSDGALRRTIRLELNPMVTLAPLGDDGLAISEERPILNLGGDRYNYARDSVRVMVARGDRRAVDTLVSRRGRHAATWVEYTDGAPTGTRQFGLPFGHPTLLGALSDEVVLVEDGQAELIFVDANGDPARRARRTDLRPQALTADLRRAHVSHAGRRARERGLPEQPAAAGAEGLLEVVPVDKPVAAFDRMLTDPASGEIWIRDYVLPWHADAPQRWTVHGASGRVLARVTTPAGMDVMQVTPTHVVGVHRDEMGVEYVVAFRVTRPGTRPQS